MPNIGIHNNNSFENDYEPELRENDYTELELRENEISDLKAHIKSMREILEYMNDIENTELFRVEGLSPNLEKEYLRLREALSSKLKRKY